jgi:diaminopimelate decarboxylase
LSALAPLSTDSRAARGDAHLIDLASKHGTPLYVYDLERLRGCVRDLRAALGPSGAEPYFATMANDRLPVLRALASAGVGACVNSVPHLELARVAGFSLADIQFTSTGITREDMRVLQRLQVRTNLDSVSQLAAWSELAGPGSECGVRINAASLLGADAGDRIGIDARELGSAVAVAQRLGGTVTGVHCYVGTNFQRAEEMLPTLAAFFRAAASVGTLRYVNIGGGIGVDYQHTGVDFGLMRFGAAIADYATELRRILRRSIRVVVEPGRALAAAAATFVTRITDVKQLRGERYASVDASVAIFPRPFHHPQSPHRIRLLAAVGPSDAEALEGRETVIVGRTTFSRDILGRVELPLAIRPGDLLALDDAGAYCQSMASRFLGQPDPIEVFLEGVGDDD